MEPDFRHSQKRRCRGHDYRSRCIYLITMMKSPDAPPFSSISADRRCSKVSPLVELSAAGKVVYESLDKLSRDHPALSILCRVAMPDHLHFVVFVTERTEQPLGSMLAAFKAECSRTYKTRYPLSALATEDLPMFEPGFNDKIVFRAGAKEAFYNYVIDNPRRYLVKRLYPEYFFHKLVLAVGAKRCGLYGNLFLLDNPVKSFVKISRVRSHTPDLDRKIKEWNETIRCGGVLVSPFINPDEKEYRDAAIKNGTGIILIVDYRFTDRQKPYKELFDLCSEGRLLIVSTEEFAAPPKTMHYTHAQELNALASQIATLAPRTALLLPR